MTNDLSTSHLAGDALPLFAIIGLGNPGEQYQHTPHTVGKRVVDLFAGTFKGEWTQNDQMMVALIECHGKPVYLIEPLTDMNAIEPALRHLCYRLKINVSE